MKTPSDRPSIRASASDLQILRKFEPVVRYTQGEPVFPTSVEGYVKRSSLWLHTPDGKDSCLVPEGSLDLDGLTAKRSAEFGSVLYLRLVPPLTLAAGAKAVNKTARRHRRSGEQFHPGAGRLARGGLLPRLMDAGFSASLWLRGSVPGATAAAAELKYREAQKEDDRTVYYGRVVRAAGWTALQYWFFYFYNPWRSGFHGVNDHESDWEMIMVYLYETGGRLVPEWVAFASHDFHGDDLRRRWDDRDGLELLDGHPVVYAGAGSHASYFQRGEYQAEVSLPLPQWADVIVGGLRRFFARMTGGVDVERSPFRIPFVDFARGDGRSVGPGGESPWSPVVIDESISWVRGYRGLWGLFAQDPLSGENAPGGPMYNRDGTPRASWSDVLGFAGLEKTPPPPRELQVLRAEIRVLEKKVRGLERQIEGQSAQLQDKGTRLKGMEGNPHLAKRYAVLAAEVKADSESLATLRRQFDQDKLILDAYRQRLAAIAEGVKDDPQAHIRHMARPVGSAPVSQALETWASLSVGILLFGLAALLWFLPQRFLIGLAALLVLFYLAESILRRKFAASIGNLSVALALTTLGVLAVTFWKIATIVVLCLLGANLIWQRVRELRG
jgi:hypothetical protein